MYSSVTLPLRCKALVKIQPYFLYHPHTFINPLLQHENYPLLAMIHVLIKKKLCSFSGTAEEKKRAAALCCYIKLVAMLDHTAILVVYKAVTEMGEEDCSNPIVDRGEGGGTAMETNILLLFYLYNFVLKMTQF